ncbi:MAG: hypothetical protein LBR56_00305, partial [Sporomusaceae bacterium]|nr:hypothetical protein [Sporomusaceae bacterium]
MVGQRLMLGLLGLALVGGQIVKCVVRLFGSPTVAARSKDMFNSRAKTAMGAENFAGKFLGRVFCSRKIAAGSLGVFGSRAKVGVLCVMLVPNRKIAHRCVRRSVCWREDHYRLFLIMFSSAALLGNFFAAFAA